MSTFLSRAASMLGKAGSPPAPAAPAPPDAAADDEAAIRDVFVARQPIFDGADRLHAYELLYRSGAQTNWANGLSPDQMCTDTVIHTLLSIGLAPLTGGTVAYVNHTRDFLVRELYELFEPKTVVVELLETVKPDAEVVAACRRLVSRGYTLALDDFVHAPEYRPLLELAKIVKVDVLNQSEHELARVVGQLKPYNVRLLAERVETGEVKETCKRLGFTLFQGYYFSRPQIVSHRELSVDQTTMLRLMNMLDDQGAGDAQIEEAFRSDPSLSYKLLRIANSAAFAGREVQSIGYALRLVGRGVLHRWLTLLLVSSVASRNGIAHELVQNALMRARLCELAGQASGRRSDMGPLFLVGLFSLLDALLRMPMASILDRMNIDAAVRDALLTRSGPYAAVLQLVEAQERGDWLAVRDAAPAAGVPIGELPVMYRDALTWAGERMGAVG